MTPKWFLISRFGIHFFLRKGALRAHQTVPQRNAHNFLSNSFSVWAHMKTIYFPNVVTPGVTTLGIRGSTLWACCAHNMQCKPWRAHRLYYPSDASAACSTLPSINANVHECAVSATSAKLPATARRYSAGDTIIRALPNSRVEYFFYVQNEMDSNDVLLKFLAGGSEISIFRTRTPRGASEPLACPSDVTCSSNTGCAACASAKSNGARRRFL